MKTICKLTFAAALAIVAASCNVQVDTRVSPYESMILRTIETKTSLSGMEVHWTEGDEVGIYDCFGEQQKFTNKTATPGTTAEFEGVVGIGTTDFYAIYPYAATNSFSSSKLTSDLPAAQTGVAGTFADDLNIMVAKGTKELGDPDVAATFHNVCGLLKFTIPASVATANSVSITNLADTEQFIAGDMTIDMSGESPVLTSVTNGEKIITCTGTFNAGSTYYIVVAPGDWGRIRVDVKIGEFVYGKESAKNLSIEAGQIINLGEIELVSTPTVSATHTYDADKRITGTEIAYDLLLKDLATQVGSVSVTIKDTESNIVKEGLAGTGANSTIAYGGYLKKGTYLASVSYELNSENVNMEDFQFEVAALANAGKNVEFTLTGEYKFVDDKYTKTVAEGVITPNPVIDAFVSDYTVTITNESDDVIDSKTVARVATGTPYAFEFPYLAAGTYTVTVECTIDGEPVTKTADFTIASAETNSTGSFTTSSFTDGGDFDWGI